MMTNTNESKDSTRDLEPGAAVVVARRRIFPVVETAEREPTGEELCTAETVEYWPGEPARLARWLNERRHAVLYHAGTGRCFVASVKSFTRG